MSEDDFDADAQLLHQLLHADAVCYWRLDPDGVAVPVGCWPQGWLRSGFLMPAQAAPLALQRGDRSLQGLPLVVRARLDHTPAAVLQARCEGPGGFFAVWHDEATLASGAEQRAALARSAYDRQLAVENTADFATEAHLQMRSLVAALPQGVAIVPHHGRRGFVNPAAARLLGTPSGEVEIGVLSSALSGFAAKALNEAEVRQDFQRLLSGGNHALLQGCIWHFGDPPQALRVTVAPIGSAALDGWVWLLDDVSDEERAKSELAEREDKFRRFYQSLQDAVVFHDAHWRLIEWNSAFRDLTGHTDERLRQMTLTDLTPAQGREPLRTAVAAELAARGFSSPHEKELLRADGKAVPVEARTFERRDAAGRIVARWEVLRDISLRKQAEAQLLLAAQVFDRSTDGVILTDTALTILTCNEAFMAMTGYRRDELVGRTPQVLKSGRHPDEFFRTMWHQLRSQGWWHGRILNRRKNGELFLKWLSITTIRDSDGNATHFIGVYRDARIVSESLARIEYLATHDELTGLANRTLFDDRLQQALARADRLQRQFALIYVDLDEFKGINETFGHSLGDALLVEAGARLARAVGEGDTVARAGGDEFFLIADTNAIEDVVSLCQRILNTLAQPYHVTSLETTVPASLGVSLFPGDGRDAETLLRKADTALHRAKRQGRNTYCFFAEEMSEQVSQQLRIKSGLRRALAQRELFLMYQPQVRLSDGSLPGCEALLRWRRDGATVSPGTFIPIAERSDLIVDITEWILGDVCAQIRAWDEAGLHVPSVSVNMAARHFMQEKLVDRLLRRIACAGGTPDRICLEITEGAVMDPVRSEALLNELRAAGFHMSMDDFGTGFSSLAYLKRFPLDELKIDRLFVSGIETDASDRAIVAATLAMARSLGMRVVAEGVETAQQIHFLRDQGCEMVQGFHLSRPLLPDDFLRFGKSREA